MSTPESIIFPEFPDNATTDPNTLKKYMKDQNFTLTRMYEDLAFGVNGTIRSNVATGSRKYTPTVSGSTTDGTGTYTTNKQVGWVLRQGVMVDFWFDIEWTAHTGTGNLLVDLPYQVALGAQDPNTDFPFIGTVQAENITFTGYLTGTALPGTRSYQIIDTVSATTFTDIQVTNADTTLRGHVRYIGVGLERE